MQLITACVVFFCIQLQFLSNSCLAIACKNVHLERRAIKTNVCLSVCQECSFEWLWVAVAQEVSGSSPSRVSSVRGQYTEPQIAPDGQASTLCGSLLPLLCECVHEWVAKTLSNALYKSATWMQSLSLTSSAEVTLCLWACLCVYTVCVRVKESVCESKGLMTKIGSAYSLNLPWPSVAPKAALPVSHVKITECQLLVEQLWLTCTCTCVFL